MRPGVEVLILSQTVSNTEAGTFAVTPTLSGVDMYAGAGETGTITVTPSLSGTDSYAFVAETGTITVTIALSGADEYGDTPERTITMLRDRHHNIVQGG